MHEPPGLDAPWRDQVTVQVLQVIAAQVHDVGRRSGYRLHLESPVGVDAANHPLRCRVAQRHQLGNDLLRIQVLLESLRLVHSRVGNLRLVGCDLGAVGGQDRLYEQCCVLVGVGGLIIKLVLTRCPVADHRDGDASSCSAERERGLGIPSQRKRCRDCLRELFHEWLLATPCCAALLEVLHRAPEPRRFVVGQISGHIFDGRCVRHCAELDLALFDPVEPLTGGVVLRRRCLALAQRPGGRLVVVYHIHAVVHILQRPRERRPWHLDFNRPHEPFKRHAPIRSARDHAVSHVIGIPLPQLSRRYPVFHAGREREHPVAPASPDSVLDPLGNLADAGRNRRLGGLVFLIERQIIIAHAMRSVLVPVAAYSSPV